MIKRAEELSCEVFTNRFGGKGNMEVIKLLETDQLQGKGRLFAINRLEPGCSLGWHQHTNDFETYFILKGEGLVDDDGQKVTVKAGDVVYTDNTQFHSIENIGSETLEFVALILYT